MFLTLKLSFNNCYFQSAVGWDHQEQLSKHESQTDAAKGFGGKYGVQKDRQDKAAGGYDDMEEVKSSYKTDRGGARGQAGDIRARFEKMATQEQEEAGRRAEEEKQRRLAREKKEREEQQQRQRQQEVMIYTHNLDKNVTVTCIVAFKEIFFVYY